MFRSKTDERLARIEESLQSLTTDERLARIEDSLQSLSEAMERIQLMFTLKDASADSTADMANMYEGLRKSVIIAREVRMARLVDLARIDSARWKSKHPAEFEPLMDELLTAAGLLRQDSYENSPDDFLTLPKGHEQNPENVFEVARPAYVMKDGGALVQQGHAVLRIMEIVEPSPVEDDEDPPTTEIELASASLGVSVTLEEAAKDPDLEAEEEVEVEVQDGGSEEETA